MTEGGPVDDTFCKIIVLTNQAVFTMLGVPSVAIGTQGLNIFDLNRQAAIGTTNLSEMARRFGSMATSELNRINPQLRTQFRRTSGYPVIAIGVYGGFDASGIPSLSVVRISHDEPSNNFIVLNQERRSDTNAVIVFNLLNEANEIMRTEELAAIQRNLTVPTAIRFAGAVATLIRQMILRRVNAEVGGVPTVLIIERGRGAYWFTRASTCPNLN